MDTSACALTLANSMTIKTRIERITSASQLPHRPVPQNNALKMAF
jgi:hypothetical protein